jgi:hypothetical protein
MHTCAAIVLYAGVPTPHPNNDGTSVKASDPFNSGCDERNLIDLSQFATRHIELRASVSNSCGQGKASST